MSSYVLDFQDIDTTKFMVVGGKGANLGELSRIEGIHVPDGFCITTEAFQRIIEETPSIHALLNQLSLLTVQDRDTIAELSGEIRRVIEGIDIPHDIQQEIAHHLSRHGEQHAYAVRSSATAEDLPTASFAGQQDTYLNIVGKEAILTHISKCWASLFTERAVTYRLQNSFDHRNVQLAVVVQKMVFPQAAGIVFTADPVTANRKIVSIDASFGLGEALVSGLVNADNYKVHDGKIIEKNIPSKKLAIYALQDGGTKEQDIEPERQNKQVLTDEQISQLERIGRRIEAHFGCPQDIEWCLVNDTFSIVQSRPITTLYPIPDAHDSENHVYLSVAHQQMMTDPMMPLGLSLWQLTAARPMYKAGGRLFVDVTSQLASSVSRTMLLDAMGQHDPLMKDALMSIIERGDVIPSLPDETKEQRPGTSNTNRPSASFQPHIENDPTIVSDLMKRSQASIEELKQTIQTKSGADVFDFILEDFQQLKKIVFDPQSSAVFMAAINASFWLN
ncbi:MAG TPA: phosphoenolpyruvate synthase, partial [Ktedonobacter sp.]|nr:phosphoenolpyruvate synthase [Ktedonobacter sp.]